MYSIRTDFEWSPSWQGMLLHLSPTQSRAASNLIVVHFERIKHFCGAQLLRNYRSAGSSCSVNFCFRFCSSPAAAAPVAAAGLGPGLQLLQELSTTSYAQSFHKLVMQIMWVASTSTAAVNRQTTTTTAARRTAPGATTTSTGAAATKSSFKTMDDENSAQLIWLPKQMWSEMKSGQEAGSRERTAGSREQE